MIIEQTIDDAGKIRILWQNANKEIYMFKFDTEPTEQILENLSNAQDVAKVIDRTPILQLDITEYKHLLRIFVEKIKSTPNITFNQYNTYLNSLDWTHSSVMRCFIFLISQKLAESKYIVLSDVTETVALRVVRDFIVTSPNWKLIKLFFNETEI